MIHIIVAGLLSLPALLVLVISGVAVAILSIPSLFLLVFRKQKNAAVSPSKRIPDHVIVTGGSSGIGLSVAKEAIRRGVAKVTIIARNTTKLEQAQKDLEKFRDETETSKSTIHNHSVSVADYDALSKLAQSICSKDDATVLFNCAGIPYTTYFESVDPNIMYDKLVQTNQVGAMKVTRAFLPQMGHGCIVFTSSAAGQVGVFGYTAYSPTKFALRGFAEALHMELCTSPVNVQIAFPTDTDTPGYATELETMPPETKALNDAAGLADPDETAKTMADAAFSDKPPFLVYFNFEGWMLANLTSGMGPVSTLGDAIAQVACLSLFRFISLFYLNDFWRIIRNMEATGESNKPSLSNEEGKKASKYGSTEPSPRPPTEKQD